MDFGGGEGMTAAMCAKRTSACISCRANCRGMIELLPECALGRCGWRGRDLSELARSTTFQMSADVEVNYSDRRERFYEGRGDFRRLVEP